VTQTKLTPKQLLDRMRKSTADLLGYDLTAKLTAAQSVRLDRAAVLRLELDDVQSRQLAGLPVDMAKFVVASEALERLVGGAPEQTTASHDFSGAKEELARLLERRAEALARRREHDEAARAAAAMPAPDENPGDDAQRSAIARASAPPAAVETNVVPLDRATHRGLQRDDFSSGELPELAAAIRMKGQT
jgi:hypothetical protein